MPIALVLAVSAMAAASTAGAATEKPEPDVLWQAFPLDPAGKIDRARDRPTSALLPPPQGRSEATPITTPAVDPAGPNLPVVLAFAALLLLATVVGLSGRRVYVHRQHKSSSLPLWQGITLPHSSDGEAAVDESRIGTSSALVGRERHVAEPHPDVPASRYSWSDRSAGRRSWSFVGARLRARRVWNEDAIPALVGSAVAFAVGALLVHLAG